MLHYQLRNNNLGMGKLIHQSQGYFNLDLVLLIMVQGKVFEGNQFVLFGLEMFSLMPSLLDTRPCFIN